MRLIKISLILIFVAVSYIQVQADEYDKYVFQIKAAKSSSESEVIFQTGFVSNKYDGIITALHGVVGRSSITATSENLSHPFTNLKITHADIANDLAVISSSSLKNNLTHKLAVNQNYNWNPLEVHGYPLGIKTQLGSRQVNLLRSGTVGLDKLFPAAMSREEKDIFKTRKSPSSYTRVLAIEAKLEPGHSGAPLINPNKEVVGVCIGGIKGTEISFAVPWSKIKFKTRAKLGSELKRLAKYDVSGLMTALNQTEKDQPKYPKLEISEDAESGEILIRNVGAPMYNSTAEFHALVYVSAGKCKQDHFSSDYQTAFYYKPGSGWRSTQKSGTKSEFSTEFLPEFEEIGNWFKMLKKKTGSIKGYCLTSVTLHHLIKVNYEGEGAPRTARHFNARKMLENYIDKKTNRQINNKSDTWTEKIDQDEWQGEIEKEQSALKIDYLYKVTSKEVLYAKKFLLKHSGSSSAGAPGTPSGLKTIVK